MAHNDRITLVSIEGVELAMSPKWMTKANLQALFQISEVVLIYSNGDDFDIIDLNDDGTIDASRLDTRKKYRCVGEEMADEQESQMIDPSSPDYMQKALAAQKRLASRIELMSAARARLIEESYVRKHPYLYEFSEEFFVDGLLERVARLDLTDAASCSFLTRETLLTRLYSFDCLKPQFCADLVEELINFEMSGLPCQRPNSMNNYGLILDDIGFTPVMTHIRQTLVSGLAAVLYPDYGGRSLDSHHSFIVQYRIGEDLDLGFHYDNSNVTLNVCLGKVFTGGSLYFCGLLLDPTTHSENFEFQHRVGTGLIHIGRHRHGANGITSGERYNLILWASSSTEPFDDMQTASAAEAPHHHHHHY